VTTQAPAGPDFLVVGAQRAGTTWLHRVLRQHPALWLPPVKELHYFDHPEIVRTIASAHERRRAGRKRPKPPYGWQLRYWLGRRDDAWYASLFAEARARGLVAGEITPAYATLPIEVLLRIRGMNPAIRLVYIMRDPVERAWSAVHNAAKKGDPATATIATAIARAREPGVVARSGYADAIERLESVFDPERIHCCFFEDLRDRPEALTGELLRFLGVAPRALDLPRAVNVAAGAKAVPGEFARAMAGDYLPTVERLCRRFEGPPHAWRARYVDLLDADRSTAANAADARDAVDAAGSADAAGATTGAPLRR